MVFLRAGRLRSGRRIRRAGRGDEKGEICTVLPPKVRQLVLSDRAWLGGSMSQQGMRTFSTEFKQAVVLRLEARERIAAVPGSTGSADVSRRRRPRQSGRCAGYTGSAYRPGIAVTRPPLLFWSPKRLCHIGRHSPDRRARDAASRETSAVCGSGTRFGRRAAFSGLSGGGRSPPDEGLALGFEQGRCLPVALTWRFAPVLSRFAGEGGSCSTGRRRKRGTAPERSPRSAARPTPAAGASPRRGRAGRRRRECVRLWPRPPRPRW